MILGGDFTVECNKCKALTKLRTDVRVRSISLQLYPKFKFQMLYNCQACGEDQAVDILKGECDERFCPLGEE